MSPSVYLAAEDAPGLAIGRKLIGQTPPLLIGPEYNGHGYGNLKRKLASYQAMGALMPVLLITDLDNHTCPSSMIKEWLGQKPSCGFLFRICVREIESWLLGDREALASFLGIKSSSIPLKPESLDDPKSSLIKLAQKAPRYIRTGLTPIRGASIGPDYNSLLSGFVETHWRIKEAAERCPSLERANKRLHELARKIT
jgi:hypothetical protein